MTETQLKELEMEVLGGEEVPREFEVTHFRATIEGLKREEKALKCNFRLYKYTRDDAKMKQIGEDLKKVRDLIDGASKRLDELQG